MGQDRPIDITADQKKTLLALIKRHLPNTTAWVYGSRVKWTSRPQSDLDLVVFTKPEQERRVSELREAFEESNLPFRVDLLVWRSIPEQYRKQIEAEHVVLVESDGESFEKILLGASGNWIEATIDDIVASSRNAIVGGPFGSNLVSHDYVPEGVPVIRGQNMGNRWVAGDFVFVTPQKAKSLEANLARPGDIVLTQRGTLGQVSLVPLAPFDSYLVSQSQMKVTVNREIADPLFFYYVLSSVEQQDYVRQNAIQTGVPHTNLGILRSTPVPVPSLDEQRAIAHVLGTLDDKIELNRRMNETLEAMARALFKSWFIDFDPVRAKMAGRDPGLPKHLADLFPNRLIDSELGPVPEGWEVGCFGDVVEQMRDKENPLTSPDDLFHHFSIPAFDEDQWPKIERGENIKSQKSRVPPGTVLLSKLNPEIERVWLVDISESDQAVCSTEFLVLRTRSPYGRSFTYCLGRSPAFLQKLSSLVTGTSKSHQRAQANAVLVLPVVLCPKPLAELFERRVAAILQMTQINRRESRSLIALRDALLPKLISGELRLRDAKFAIEIAS